MGDGTTNNRLQIYSLANGESHFYVRTSNLVQADIVVSNIWTSNTYGKIAAAYKLNSVQQASNATLGTQDNAVNIPTVDRMAIGAIQSSVTTLWNGWIKQLNYYPQRLTNAELQAFSKL